MNETAIFRGIPPRPVPDDTLRVKTEQNFAQEAEAALSSLRQGLASLERQELLAERRLRRITSATEESAANKIFEAESWKRDERSMRADSLVRTAAQEIFAAESRYSAACLKFLASRPGYATECYTAGDAILRLAASAFRSLVKDGPAVDPQDGLLAYAALPAGAPDISGLDLGKFQRYV